MWEAIIWTFFGVFLGFGCWAMNQTPPIFMLSRACFLLAAVIFLSRLSWWIAVENHFGSKLLTYIFVFAVFGGTSIALVYGLQLVSGQEQEIKWQTKEKTESKTQVEKRLSILENLQIKASQNQDTLEKKYPKGYVLFASEKYVIYIPSNKEGKSLFSLDWDNSRITYLDSSFVVLLLKSFHYYANEIQVKNLTIVLERKIGNLAGGLYFNNIGIYVELIDDREEDITFVIGFKSVKSIPNKGEIKPEIENFIDKIGIRRPVFAINTNVKKYITIQDLTISSGWTIIENQ